MKAKARSILQALAAGVQQRAPASTAAMPHSIIAELFTDAGVGSW